MNADAQNEKRLLESRIQELERVVRRIPSRFAGGSSITLPYFTILGGNTLVAPIAAGIIYRSDTVNVSELPAGSGGTGIVTMPAWPIPAGLPNGVGVCRQIGTANYFFVLLDSTNVAGVNYDLRVGRGMFGYANFNMDVVVGAVTYRYAFKALEAIN